MATSHIPYVVFDGYYSFWNFSLDTWESFLDQKLNPDCIFEGSSRKKPKIQPDMINTSASGLALITSSPLLKVWLPLAKKLNLLVQEWYEYYVKETLPEDYPDLRVVRYEDPLDPSNLRYLLPGKWLFTRLRDRSDIKGHLEGLFSSFRELETIVSSLLEADLFSTSLKERQSYLLPYFDYEGVRLIRLDVALTCLAMQKHGLIEGLNSPPLTQVTPEGVASLLRSLVQEMGIYPNIPRW